MNQPQPDATGNLAEIKNRIVRAATNAGRAGDTIELVAVSKNFDADTIRPVIEAGQNLFGENRVQEAERKWPLLKQQYDRIKLHLIGPLQSNKAAQAVALFDVIETLDREKIVTAIAAQCANQHRTPELFVQINTGLEPQKAGIAPKDAGAFVKWCTLDAGLNIAGLMCIPPFDEPPARHFALLREIGQKCGIVKLSMGMSADFEQAIEYGASQVRVGSAIFGSRSPIQG